MCWQHLCCFLLQNLLEKLSLIIIKPDEEEERRAMENRLFAKMDERFLEYAFLCVGTGLFVCAKDGGADKGFAEWGDG